MVRFWGGKGTVHALQFKDGMNPMKVNTLMQPPLTPKNSLTNSKHQLPESGTNHGVDFRDIIPRSITSKPRDRVR